MTDRVTPQSGWQTAITSEWGNELRVVPIDRNRYSIVTPFRLPDGDGYAVVAERTGDGWMLTDDAQTQAWLDLNCCEVEPEYLGRLANIHNAAWVNYVFVRRLDNAPTLDDVTRFLSLLIAAHSLPALQLVQTKQVNSERPEVTPILPYRDRVYAPFNQEELEYLHGLIRKHVLILAEWLKNVPNDATIGRTDIEVVWWKEPDPDSETSYLEGEHDHIEVDRGAYVQIGEFFYAAEYAGEPDLRLELFDEDVLFEKGVQIVLSMLEDSAEDGQSNIDVGAVRRLRNTERF